MAPARFRFWENPRHQTAISFPTKKTERGGCGVARKADSTKVAFKVVEMALLAEAAGVHLGHLGPDHVAMAPVGLFQQRVGAMFLCHKARPGVRAVSMVHDLIQKLVFFSAERRQKTSLIIIAKYHLRFPQA